MTPSPNPSPKIDAPSPAGAAPPTGSDLISRFAIKNPQFIDLSKPVRSESVAAFPRPRTVFIYVCGGCSKEVRVRASLFSGKNPTPSKGAIHCPHCLSSPS